MLISYGLSFVVYLIVDLFFPGLGQDQKLRSCRFTNLIRRNSLLLSVHQARAQQRMIFRFIVPISEFAKQVRGAGR